MSSALVVGGSIAGLTAAISLRQAGLEVDVIEREANGSVGGSGITLMTPALRMLARVGLLDQCVEMGYGIDELVTCDADGAVHHRVPLSRVANPGTPAIVGMRRSDLQEALAQASRRAGVIVRLGTSITSWTQSSDGVDVALDDGTTGRYELVVAADGSSSSMREQVLGTGAPVPTYIGQAVWRAVVPRPPAVTGTGFLYGPRRKAGFTPISDDAMYAYVVEPQADRRRPAPELRPAAMRELLSEFGGPIAEVRDAIVDPAEVDVRALTKLIVPVPWSAGRVVLIGDAVHTTTPQLAMGGAIAMEDGVVLAEMIGAGGRVQDTLTAFTERRYDRCRTAVQNSTQLSEWEKNAARHASEAAELIAQSVEYFDRAP